MALKLSKELPSGATVEYWRVSPSLTVDLVDQTIHAKVMPYVNATARLAGKPPLPGPDPLEAPDHISMSGVDVITALQTGDPRPALYGVLKALPFFSGAEDV